MNKEIKERIETINKGEVPDGYIRTKAGLMPCDWINSKPLTTNMIFENISDKNHGNEYPVLSATQEKGIVLRSEIEKDINFNKENTNSYKLVCKGDYVISLRSFQGGIEYSNIDGLVSPAYTVIRPIIPISDGYYKEYFKTNDFIDRLNSAIYGIRDGKQIGYKDFAELVVHNPPLEEQEKIAEILSRCDKVIEECEKQVEEYRNLKKTCLSKMFPQKGSNIPEIRFPGFTDAWEQRKLGELSEKTFGGGTPNTSNNEYWNGNIPWFQSSDISEGKLFDIAPKKFISQDGLSKSAAQLIPENSIAIITRVGVGKLAFVPFSYTTSQDFLSLSRLKTEPFFTVYACYKKLQSELNAVQGTSIKGITKDELLAKQIMIPNYAEQRQIGAYFKNLDNLITLHQRKVDAYTQMKKALIQLLLKGIVRVNKQKEILP